MFLSLVRCMHGHRLIAALGFGLLVIAGSRNSQAKPATQPASGALLTRSEAKDVQAVVNSLIKAGFPDAEHATVYCGALNVSVTIDPSKDAMPLPSDASGMQETMPESKSIKYGFAFKGLHFKLADGSWIISMSYHFTPKKNDAVSVDPASIVNLATLTSDAQAESPMDAAHDASEYIEKLSPLDRERATQSLNRFVPVSKLLRLSPESFPTALILLERAGWHDADDLAIAIADTRATSYWQLRPWTNPDSQFDPTGEYPAAKTDESVWKKTHLPFVAEPPATAVRRAMFRWCRGQLMTLNPEEAMLPLDPAAACCKAMVDPMDPQQNVARVDYLLAAAKLPVGVAEKASLVDRLQGWEARPRMPKMSVSSDGGASFSTSFSAPASTYEPDRGDLDALIALLNNDKPSRYFDFSGARSIGDNAWRAVATLLKNDPRVLAGYATDHPWTPHERSEAAKIVQAWWKTHRTQFGEH